jgi:ribonuclease-3
MSEPTVVFRTYSDIEASIVQGLLDAHGIEAGLSSDVPHSVFPLTVNGLGEVRVSVSSDQAEAATRLISDYQEPGDSGRAVRIRDEFEALEESIGHRFRDRGTLEHALTHRSRANEDVTGGVADNESLEFLGDALLGFVIAELLCARFADRDEGQKSKMKGALVSTLTLARQAVRLGLGEHLLLGRGEEKSGGRRKHALLADGYEAIIVHPPGVRAPDRRGRRRDHNWRRPQVRVAGGTAGARRPAAGVRRDRRGRSGAPARVPD